MINLLIYVVVLCIVLGLVYYIVTLLPLPEPFKNVAVIAILLIFILLLLGVLFGGIPMPRFPA